LPKKAWQVATKINEVVTKINEVGTEVGTNIITIKTVV